MNDLKDQLTKLTSLLDSEEGAYDAQELFRQIYRMHNYGTDGNRKVGTIECGSFAAEDTPKTLYRLLFLTKAAQVDFSSMYKSNGLFALTSPDGQFVADFQFYKYELAAYLSAAREYVTGRESNLVCGAPGADNGLRSNSEIFKLWAETLKKCLARTWMIYGGNDFEV